MKRDKWENDFNSWFNNVLSDAEIMDIRYPVKGLYVWMPYGIKLRNRVIGIIRQLLEDTSHQEVLFPLLIPRDVFEKEAEHIKGFEDEVYWVTKGGTSELNVDLALRPTSETSIYPMLKLWIRSHTDLPLQIYQVVNIFRHETKATKPLIRLREVTTFKEAHTAHESEEDAEEQVKKAVEIYKEFFDELGVPYVITKRPAWDTFAGAKYSIAFDMLAPNGRTLQIGTVHNLGQGFSKVFDLTYETPDGDQEYVHQTCYGISDRVIASVLIAHGDDHGPCLPPNIAPIQVVIVPVPFKEEDADVAKGAEKVRDELEDAGIRTQLDDRDLRPGDKYYRWERRGVPVRIEIGPKELKEEKVTIVRRDTGEKLSKSRESLIEDINEIFKKIKNDLKERARSYLEDKIEWAKDLEKARDIIGKTQGIAQVSWCGQEDCGQRIEEETGGDILGPEFEGETKKSECIACGRKAEKLALVARTY